MYGKMAHSAKNAVKHDDKGSNTVETCLNLIFSMVFIEPICGELNMAFKRTPLRSSGVTHLNRKRYGY